MYLKKSFNKKRNKTQLSFVQGYRIDGKVKHKVIQNLGYLEDYLDKYEDPIAHFQQIAKEWNAQQKTPETIEVKLLEKLPDQCSNRKNLGYAIIKLIYAKLQIREFFQNKQRQLPVEYNLNSVFSLLVFNRFLFPSSKKNAYETKDKFFDSFNFSMNDVYQALDYFSRFSQELQTHLHARVCGLVGRDSEKAWANAEFKKWVLEPDGYVTTMEKSKDGKEVPFTYKSRLYAKEITKKDSNGARRLKMKIYQKQMVYYK